MSYQTATGGLLYVLNRASPRAHWVTLRPIQPEPSEESDYETTIATIVRASMAERCILLLNLDVEGVGSEFRMDFRSIVEAEPDYGSVALGLRDDPNIYGLTTDVSMEGVSAILAVGYIHGHCVEGAG